MKTEEKQALIDFAECVLANYESRSYMAGTKSEALIRIALAALTAQPVKLPKSERLDGNGYGYYFDMNDVFTALEEAGIKFEVQE